MHRMCAHGFIIQVGIAMSKGRLEAFSDGVIAILITIMVLEMKAPHEADLAALRPLIPVLLSYTLSFSFLGIYWNNHHHLLQAVHHVNGRILWANLHLLFWLSLIPFVTSWMGENPFVAWPVALYGIVLLFAACAYFTLSRVLVEATHRDDVRLAVARVDDDAFGTVRHADFGPEDGRDGDDGERCHGACQSWHRGWHGGSASAGAMYYVRAPA